MWGTNLEPGAMPSGGRPRDFMARLFENQEAAITLRCRSGQIRASRHGGNQEIAKQQRRGHSDRKLGARCVLNRDAGPTCSGLHFGGQLPLNERAPR